MRRPLPWLFASTLASLLAISIPALGSADVNIATVFAIRKSTNRNRVDYGIHLDDSCRPRDGEPVYSYFRRLERGPGLVRELSLLERTVYGVRAQNVRTAGDVTQVSLRLRALPDRAITVRTEPGQHGCSATPITTILQHRAEITDILVVLSGPRSVSHVEITGRALPSGQELREIIEP